METVIHKKIKDVYEYIGHCTKCGEIQRSYNLKTDVDVPCIKCVTKDRKEKMKLSRYPVICSKCGGDVFRVFGHKSPYPGCAYVDRQEIICANCGE
jgi:hypothetical protein